MVSTSIRPWESRSRTPPASVTSCWFGWKTLPYAFKQAGEHYEPVRVEVIGPGYSKWIYGPVDTDQLIKGSASDWARLAVRRVDVSDTRLKVTGEHAEKAVLLAQTYL